MGFGILSLIFYPLHQRNYYRKYYQKFIKETAKNNFDEVFSITLSQKGIEANSLNTESKITYEALAEINEIGGYIFVKLKSGASLILPKKKIENMEMLKEHIDNIAQQYNLKTTLELNWKWK